MTGDTGVPAAAFPRPSREFTDQEGREIHIERLTEKDHEALITMYIAFDPEDRAQGIPPSSEPDIREWVEAVTAEDCLNIVAWHGEDIVGHVMFVPDGTGASELAIFVQQAYQGAYIGTELIRTGLGAAADAGIENVWLTVERWNTPAVTLYEKIGFETNENTSFELEMSLRLATDN